MAHERTACGTCSRLAALHPAAPTRVLSGAVAVVATVILEPARALDGLGPAGVDGRNLHPGRRAHGALGLGLGPPGCLGGTLGLESRAGVRAALGCMGQLVVVGRTVALVGGSSQRAWGNDRDGGRGCPHDGRAAACGAAGPGAGPTPSPASRSAGNRGQRDARDQRWTREQTAYVHADVSRLWAIAR